MPSSDSVPHLASSPPIALLRLRRQAWFGLVVTGLVIGFDLAGFRTNWLLPKSLFCGQIHQGRTGLVTVRSATRLQPGSQAVCVHELIKPYSQSSGSATVSMSLRESDGSLKLFDTQLFLAKDLGSKRFNDTPGDWIFLSSAEYNKHGWLVSRSTAQVASWSSDFLTLELRQKIWKMVQDQLVNRDLSPQISLQRNVSEFVAINGALVIVLLLVLNAFFDLIREYRRSIMLAGRPARFSRIRTGLWGPCRFKQWKRGALVFGGLSLLVGMLLVSRLTNWLQPRPFWCKQYAGDWKICLHEIHRLPSHRLRIVILGVSIVKPNNKALYAKMQLFTALPRDKIGFVDVPGSWHFMDRSYFSPSGLMERRAPETLSSIVDPLLPGDLQIAFWNDIAYHVQSKYKARRLSIQSKLLEVSESYLLLLLGVLLAIWTLLLFLELRLALIDQSSA